MLVLITSTILCVPFLQLAASILIMMGSLLEAGGYRYYSKFSYLMIARQGFFIASPSFRFSAAIDHVRSWLNFAMTGHSGLATIVDPHTDIGLSLSIYP